MESVLTKTKRELEEGKITAREAAVRLYKAGFINYIDEHAAKAYLNDIKQI